MYQCKLCIVRACCSSWCDKIMTNARELAVHIISTNRCPDCGEDLINLPYKVDPMYFCIPCTKVFVHRDPGSQPKTDVSHGVPMTLEDIKDEESDNLGIVRLKFDHSRTIIESTNHIIDERLREKNPKIPAPDPQEEVFPSVIGDKAVAIYKTKIIPKVARATIVYGQNTLTPRIWTQDDIDRSKTNGDFLINESGHWVKYYESQCNESSYNGIYTS